MYFLEVLEDTLLGLIQDTMPPQAAILGEFEDHYTQILLPTLNVALTTTRNSNIQLDFSQTPGKNYPPPDKYVPIFVILLKTE